MIDTKKWQQNRGWPQQLFLFESTMENCRSISLSGVPEVVFFLELMSFPGGECRQKTGPLGYGDRLGAESSPGLCL